jgi:hypothetical protein
MTVRKAKLDSNSYFSLSDIEMVICHVECGECNGEKQTPEYGPSSLSGAKTDCKECLGYGHIEASVPGSVFIRAIANEILSPFVRAIKANTSGSTKEMLAELGDMIEKARVKQVVED